MNRINGNMELQQIIGFYQIAKQESFTKAAVTTFRTQSALSHQVKALENELDCQLIERVGRRKIKLTLAGLRFMEFASSYLDQHQRLFEDISEMKGSMIGRLKIAAQFGPLNYIFPDLVSCYRKRYPRVELKIFESAPFDTIASVKAGDVDFGVVSEALVPGDLAVVRWRHARPCVVTTKGHPLTKLSQISIVDLAKYPLIMTPKILKYSLRRRLEKKFMQQGLKYSIAMEASNFELASKYVEIGFGIAFAALGYGVDKDSAGKLVFTPIDNLFKPDHLSVVMRKDTQLRVYQSDFIAMLFQNNTDLSEQ
jgi:DNA-binding transcriptional LysR family regulator